MQELYISRKSASGLYRARVLQVDREKMRVRVYIPAFASEDDPSKEDPELLEANDNKDSNEETTEDTQNKENGNSQSDNSDDNNNEDGNEENSSEEAGISLLDEDNEDSNDNEDNEEEEEEPSTDDTSNSEDDASKPPEEDSPETEDKEKSDEDEKSEEQKRWEEEHYKKYPWADASSINFMDKSLEPTFGRMFALCGEESEEEVPVLLPNKGDIVWIGFEGGDIGRAVYVGNLGSDLATKGATWIKDMRSKYGSWASSLGSGGGALGGIGLGSAEQARLAVQYGESVVGKVTYVYGATDPQGGKSDCSGFTQWCYKMAGVSIGRSTAAQINDGEPVDSINNALPGDLIIWSTDSSHGKGAHVVMWYGDGKVIECSSGKGVWINNWSNRESLYNSKPIKAIRRICPATSAVDVSSDGTAEGNERAIYQFLRTTLGLNVAGAAGVLANIECESGFIPTRYGDGGTSYGICQWHNDRFTDLKNHAGSSYNTLSGQLSFLQSELAADYSGMMSSIKSVPNTADGAVTAASHWCVEFERPDNKDVYSNGRATAAREYFEKYKNS